MAFSLAAFTASAVIPKSDSYIQRGLIAQWDGFENTGAGGHATSLTEWKDTSGTYSFVFNSGSGSGITVDGGALVFPGTQAGYATLDAAGTDATFEAARNGMCEIVLSANPATTQMVALQSSIAAGIALGSLTRSSVSVAPGLVVNSGEKSQYPFFNWSVGTNTLTTTYASGLAQNAWANGGSLAMSSEGDSWIRPNNNTYLGHRADLSSGQAFAGRIFALRLYSKALSADEIAYNSVVDRLRFRDEDVDGYRTAPDGSIETICAVTAPAGAAYTINGEACVGSSNVWVKVGSTVTIVHADGSGIAPVWVGLPADLTRSADGLTATFTMGCVPLACRFSHTRPTILDGITSDGAQWFNTGFCANQNTKLEMSVTNRNFTAWGCYFGADETTRRFALAHAANQVTYAYFAAVNSGSITTGNAGSYIYRLSSAGYYANGVLKWTPSAATFQMTVPIGLLCF